MLTSKELLDAAKVIADSQEFSSTQVVEMSKAQLASHLGLSPAAGFWSGGNYGYFTGIRSHLVDYVVAKENRIVAQSIKGKLTLDELQWIVDNIKRVVEHLEDQE